MGIAIGAAASKTLFAQAPAVRTRGVKPVVVAAANGNRYKNGGPQTGVERAFNLMTSGGKDVLEAVIAGVNLCELDPEDTSVGYGGLPNADGIGTPWRSAARSRSAQLLPGESTTLLINPAIPPMSDFARSRR